MGTFKLDGAPLNATLAAVVVIASATTSSAHGPAVGVTFVAAADDSGPTVVGVSEGLVQRIENEWRYVCPSLFGDELAPLALSLDGERTFVVGTDDLFVLAADSTVTPQNRPEFSRRFVTGLGRVADRMFAFRIADRRTEIVEITDPPSAAVWSDAGVYHSISADDAGFWAARVSADGVGHVSRLDVEGAVVAQHTFVAEPGESVLRAMALGDDVYVSTLTSWQTGRLTRIDGAGDQTRIVDATEPLRGPLAVSDDAAYFIADGVLDALPDATTTPVFSERATCLDQHGGHSYLCSRTTLLGLDASGTVHAVLDLAELQGPVAGALNADVSDRCALQWRVFQDDLRAVGALPDASPAAPTPAKGCTISRGVPSNASLVLVPLLLLLALRVASRLRWRL